MEEEILAWLIIIGIASLNWYAGYKYGQAKREDEWQSKPIIYTVGKESAVWVGRNLGKVHIQVFNRKLVYIDNSDKLPTI